jgi:RNA polymerase sigma-70 factor (ECF subfamily)
VTDDATRRRFELLALPHLDAAYNLARWLTRNDHDAEDVVQDAMLRALRYFASFHGDQVRAWLLQIVRHTCYSWLKENRPAERVLFDDDDGPWLEDIPAADEAAVGGGIDRAQLDQAIAALPVAYREVLVLRELEDLAYRDIARIADIPLGTVMSRLARARGLLRQALRPRPLLHPVESRAQPRRAS